MLEGQNTMIKNVLNSLSFKETAM